MTNTEFKVIGKLANVELSQSNKGISIATCIVCVERENTQGIKSVDEFKVVAFKENAVKLSTLSNTNVIVFGHLNASNFQGHYNAELVVDNITTSS